MAVGASPADGAPGELAPAGSSCGGGGWWASRLGSERQGGTLRGPVPASRGESRLRVINSFPGSRAEARARAGRQPAQHPGRLPRLSSPTSVAPSSGEEPPWSLQTLWLRPRGTRCLSCPAWVSCSPQRGCPNLPQVLPRYQGAGNAHSLSIAPTENGTGLQHPSDRKTPSLPYSPSCRGSSSSRGLSPLGTSAALQPARCLSKSSPGWGW